MNKNEFFEKINEFASKNNMKCKLEPFGLIGKGSYSIHVSYRFSDGLYIMSRSLYYHILEVEDGKVNYWHEVIHDCKHHITGPGYGSSTYVQTPITLDVLCDGFLSELKKDAAYYEPINR